MWATRYSHLLNPLFTAPMPPLLRSMGVATLATVDAVRVGTRPLETEDSGRALLGHYHSGIYRDSHLNRLINNTRNHSFLFRSAQRWTHLARPQTRAARHRGWKITQARPYNESVPSHPPDPVEFLMISFGASPFLQAFPMGSGS